MTNIVTGGTVNLNGDNLSGSNLVITVGGTITIGDQFTIINNEGINAVVGQFVQGISYTSGAYNFSINYAGGDGNDVVLTTSAIPEPSTWIGGALAFAALAYMQRRRLKKLIVR
jgi:hypothetical protein